MLNHAILAQKLHLAFSGGAPVTLPAMAFRDLVKVLGMARRMRQLEQEAA